MDEKLEKMLMVMAEKLNTTVERLWEILIYQARVECISLLMQFIFSGIGLFLSFKFFKFYIESNNVKEEGVGALFFSLCSLFVFGVYFIIMLIIFPSEFPTAAFNPEYFAFNKIIKSLR